MDDVVSALVAGARVDLPRSDWWDLPGPDALSGTEILLRVAAVMGRRPILVEVPLVTPRLSSHWIRLVTRADIAVARELVEGLTSDLLAARPGYWRAAGLGPPMPLEEAARRALSAERDAISLLGRLAEAVAGILAAAPRRAPRFRPPGRPYLPGMDGSLLHLAFTRAEEALLARTLVGRRLARDVRGPDGRVEFAGGTEIDRALLDRAREKELLDDVAAAAEPGTSDTELEDLFVWLAERRRAREGA